MLTVPLPFVTLLLLVILLARLALQAGGPPWRLMAFVAACAVLVTMVGLRWSFDIRALRFVQPVVASLLPPLAWVLFSGLARRGRGAWLHALPVLAVAGLTGLSRVMPSLLDVALAAIYLGYGVALLRTAATGPDRWVSVRFSEAAATNRAAVGAGLILLVSGVIDGVIAGEFFADRAAHIQTIIVAANFVTLPLLAFAVARVGQSVPQVGAEVVPEAREDDAAIVAAVERVIRDKQLFRDPELTLDRLARRALIPTRQISGAVNRVLGQNVSQWVNGFRVDEAKRLLLETDLPVTEIMFEAGFQTKSNFNTAFSRATGTSPSGFRRAGRAG